MQERAKLAKWIGILAAVLAFGGVGVAIWMSGSNAGGRLHRDPTWLSPDTRSFDEVMDPKRLVQPSIAGAFEGITIETNAPDVVVRSPAHDELDAYVDNALMEFHEVPWGGAYEGSKGKLWLDHFAVAYGSLPENQNYSVRLPARFFDRQLKEISEGSLKEMGIDTWQRQMDFQGRFPRVRFAFKGKFDGDVEVKVLGFHIFDARSHASLAGGYSWGGDLKGDFHRMETDLRMWHAAPILVVMDIAIGPPELIEFPAQQGAETSFPLGKINLIVMSEGLEHRSTSSDGKTETLTLSPSNRSSEREFTSVLFGCAPKAFRMPIEFEFLGSDGNLLKSGGSGTSGVFMESRVQAKPGAIRTVRLKYYPHRHRLIFRIPRVPGLPEANENLDDLFDATVPEVRIRREYEYRDLVQNLTQLGFQIGPGPNPTFAAVNYTNVTVRQLVQDYSHLYGLQYGATVNDATMILSIEDQSLKARWRRMWTHLRRTFF